MVWGILFQAAATARLLLLKKGEKKTVADNMADG